MAKYKFLFKQQVIEFYLQNSKNRSLIHLNLNLTWYKRFKMGNFLQKLSVYTLSLLIQVLPANVYKTLKNKVNGLIPKLKGRPTMKPKYLKISPNPKSG